VTAENFTLPKSQDLERSRHIGRVCAYLEALPLDHAWKVSVEERKSERSLQQNRYLFGVAYARISEATGLEKQDLHEDFLRRHFGTRLKRVPISRYHPDGFAEVPVRTTTTDEHGRRSVLGKHPFGEFVEFVQRFAAEHYDVYVPDPDPDHAMHEEAA
jgi:hypothetical protein